MQLNNNIPEKDLKEILYLYQNDYDLERRLQKLEELLKDDHESEVKVER